MGLKVALVGGPMYDPLYETLDDDVEVIVHADHPTLNRTVAEMVAAGERIDVLSTHSKYAPSQSDSLVILDGLVNVDELAPRAVDLCRFDRALLCAPRNIDVRVLWYRTDVIDSPPDTWEDVDAGGHAFGFPGRESGLFGTFFELVVAHGGRLFDDDAAPTMVSDEAVGAVELLCRLAARGPSDLPTWHYDQVDAALLDGRIPMAAAWPGAYGPIRASHVYERLQPALYPAGPAQRVSYSGAHAWAIPTTCADIPAAAALIEKLCAYDSAVVEASHGSVCAHVAAFAGVAPVDATDERRLALTRDTIATAMITYPSLPKFPEVEDAGWSAINAALRDEVDAKTAVAQIQQAAEEALQ